MISENAKRVLEARYLRRNSDRGIAESPGQFFERVARAVSEAEMINGTPSDAMYWQGRSSHAHGTRLSSQFTHADECGNSAQPGFRPLCVAH